MQNISQSPMDVHANKGIKSVGFNRLLEFSALFFPYLPVTGSNVLSIVLAREREDKKARAVQNGHIKDLDPIVVTTHLPSIKIFFNTIQV